MTRLINNWEGRGPKFLTKVFDGDSIDIVNFLSSNESKKIIEIGFGNNRLLSKILEHLPKVSYYGFDKTESFVERARENYQYPNLRFGLLDIENLSKLTELLNMIKPDSLILRYIIEHLPNWDKVLDCLNNLSTPSILISIYTRPVKKSRSTTLKTKTHAYTVNFFSPNDLTNLLNSYKLYVSKHYDKVDHTLRIFRKA